MILTVERFCNAVSRDLSGLLIKIEKDTNRIMTDREKKELAQSYKQVSHMLGIAQENNKDIADVYISTSDLLLEYHLPKASSWCDLVLLGVGDKGYEVIIVELKNYRKETETKPGDFEGLIWHNGTVRQHPAAQVRQYTQYCQYFHSTVVEEKANCSGLVFFTQEVNLTPYKEGPNKELCKEYPLYNASEDSVSDLAKHIAKTIKKGNETFAEKFIVGDYKQDRNILKQVAESLTSMRTSEVRNPFVLLDGQDKGFSLVLSKIEKLKESQKEVIIVAGPPGSGKSAVAANLWVECAKRYNKRGNVLFVTTSSSQYDPWAHTFEESTGKTGAAGMVVKANAFNPGLNGRIIKEQIAPFFSKLDEVKYIHNGVLRYDLYEDYLKYAVEKGIINDYNDCQYISIVDEAHALIDPSAPHFSTNKAGGWCYQVGPQAYHIIKQSRVSVFLMDDHQSFRDNETTNIETIKLLAERFGAHVSYVSLADMQFRCAGSKEYVDWVESLFTPSPLHNYKSWKEKFEFKLVDSPDEVDKWLLEKKTSSIRVLSSYTVKWKSKSTLREIHGDCTDYDFILQNKDKSEYKKFWNNPNAYDIFVKGTQGSSMHDDPLCEIGCPYAVRGYDYDYVGVLSLSDIIIRDGNPYIILDNCQETATNSKRKQARDESEKNHKAIQKSLPRSERTPFDGVLKVDKKHPQAWEYASTIAQAYRILLTRGIKGVCLYIKDEETRNFVKSLLK